MKRWFQSLRWSWIQFRFRSKIQFLFRHCQSLLNLNWCQSLLNLNLYQFFWLNCQLCFALNFANEKLKIRQILNDWIIFVDQIRINYNFDSIKYSFNFQIVVLNRLNRFFLTNWKIEQIQIDLMFKISKYATCRNFNRESFVFQNDYVFEIIFDDDYQLIQKN